MPETLVMIRGSAAPLPGPGAARSDNSIASLLEGLPGRELLELAKSENVFVQGSQSDSIYFVQKGKIKVSVVSVDGKEAVVALLYAPGFVGEECLAGQMRRSSTATALEPCTLIRVRKQAMLQGIQEHAELCSIFVTSLLSRGLDLEESLCNQLFNISEKRLAWILIKLARSAADDSRPDTRIPRLSHETLAEMVGTTRSRVTQFMNKFRTLDLIEYDDSVEMTVRTELLTALLLNV